ncbi:hypothetical protein CASFOL_032300 [Castilleja foliolosa]|uniref:BHLH domain-containing protein n=1 Tax=Castilleja foliolosa TaxID=1961234 RepID=A0ABD3C2E3_9LAMI
MENIDDEYRNYWETNTFLQTEELDCYFDESMSVSYEYDSSSPEGMQSSSSPPSKNIVSERNRRKKLNEKLYALRSVVPNITKMDKASTIRDAIEYIKSLHSEEKKIKAEISDLERGIMTSSSNSDNSEFNQESCCKRKRTKMVRCIDPIEVIELRVSNMGEKTIVVSLECNNKGDTIIKLCKAFESLNLKIITSSINAFSGRLFKTVFLQGDEDDEDDLRVKIEDAIAALNNPESPMSY